MTPLIEIDDEFIEINDEFVESDDQLIETDEKFSEIAEIFIAVDEQFIANAADAIVLRCQCHRSAGNVIVHAGNVIVHAGDGIGHVGDVIVHVGDVIGHVGDVIVHADDVIDRPIGFFDRVVQPPEFVAPAKKQLAAVPPIAARARAKGLAFREVAIVSGFGTRALAAQLSVRSSCLLGSVRSTYSSQSMPSPERSTTQFLLALESS